MIASDHRKTRPRGYGLIEVALSTLILGVALSLAVAGLSRLATERRAIDHRIRANQEVSNVLERLLERPWSERTAKGAESITLDPAARRRLPGATLKITVEEEAGEPAGRRIEIEIRWPASKPGEVDLEPPVRLVAWTHPPREDRK